MPHRLVPIAALAAAALAAPAAHAAETQSVRVLSCEPAQGDTGGSVRYQARMQAVQGTSRMAVRIRLFERFPGERFHRVDGEGLGSWKTSRAGVSGFRYRHRIRGLRSGATYRAVIDYRWYSTSGEIIRRARERSKACRQRGLPNLRIGRIRLEPGDVDGTWSYSVRVVNRGVAPAQNVSVLLRIDGEVVDDAETVEVLEPGEVRTVTFNGPQCRDGLRVVVDPKDLVAESRERDNVRRVSCL